MRERERFFFIFFFFFLLAIGVIAFKNTPFVAVPAMFFAKGVSAANGAFVSFVTNIFRNNKEAKLAKENARLEDQIVNEIVLKQDIAALRDQFQTTTPNALSLLPAKVIGMPAFLPGVSIPEQFTIDKGKTDGVDIGQAVIVGNNLVGVVTAVSQTLSSVRLIYNPKISLAARVLPGLALGVARGEQGGKVFLNNVLLSETISNSNLVVTVGDTNEKAKGIPSDLVIGKITSVEKKPSALFQTATVRSLLDFTKLTTVFVYKGVKTK